MNGDLSVAVRRDQLQLLIDAAYLAFDSHARDPQSRRSLNQVFSNLQVSGEQCPGKGSRLPACQFLSVISVDAGSRLLRNLYARFQAIEPLLTWRRRQDASGTASENFQDGHANAMIIGPGGLQERNDVWFGATLMAPNVRYPDHHHAPEEVYLVMSEGEFQRGDSTWFSPGIGGSFYNPPGIRHAMRSTDKPLFAFWVLLPKRSDDPALNSNEQVQS